MPNRPRHTSPDHNLAKKMAWWGVAGRASPRPLYHWCSRLRFASWRSHSPAGRPSYRPPGSWGARARRGGGVGDAGGADGSGGDRRSISWSNSTMYLYARRAAFLGATPLSASPVMAAASTSEGETSISPCSVGNRRVAVILVMRASRPGRCRAIAATTDLLHREGPWLFARRQGSDPQRQDALIRPGNPASGNWPVVALT